MRISYRGGFLLISMEACLDFARKRENLPIPNKIAINAPVVLPTTKEKTLLVVEELEQVENGVALDNEAQVALDLLGIKPKNLAGKNIESPKSEVDLAEKVVGNAGVEGAIEQQTNNDEPLIYETPYIYEDAYIKTCALLERVETYLDPKIFTLLCGNAFLHYVIVQPFEIGQWKNDLYTKYSIANKGFIVSSVSDGGSSSSLFTTDAMSQGGFLMQDLVRTPYGEYVYSILEQLQLSAVLL